MSTLVEIVPYDPEWPLHFLEAEADLRKRLGPALLAVEHVGSTSVPGMPAKPVIDMDVTLTGLSAIAGAGECLVDAGYEPRGNRYDDDVWAFLLKRSAPDLRVYLCAPRNRTHRHRLLFRDYLRCNEDAAGAYARLKEQLAKRFPFDGDRYTSEKSAFIQEMVSRARAQFR